MLLFLLVLLVLVFFVLILLLLVFFVLVLFVFIFVLVLILVFVLVLVVLILVLIVFVLVLILLLFLELGKSQVVAGIVVVGILAQCLLVVVNGLGKILLVIGNVAQVITCLSGQFLAGAGIGQLLQQAHSLLHGLAQLLFAPTLLHRRLRLVLLDERTREIELGNLTVWVGFQRFAVLNLGLGILLVVIEFVA